MTQPKRKKWYLSTIWFVNYVILWFAVFLNMLSLFFYHQYLPMSILLAAMLVTVAMIYNEYHSVEAYKEVQR